MGLDDLFVPHMPRLYHAAAQVLRHRQDSEDAVQEGLLAAFRHRDQFQGRAKLSTWLHRIVVNAALMKLRRRRHELTIASTEEEFQEGDFNGEVVFADGRPTPEEEYSKAERYRILVEAIRELPARYRTVVQMCDIDGLMEREAAEKLGTAVHVVKSRRFRGRRMLFKRLRYRPFRTHTAGRKKNAAAIMRPEI